jgi:hypothetical protein
LLNTVSAAIHPDTHFRATKNVLLEATYHLDVLDLKNGLSDINFNFFSLLRHALNLGIKIMHYNKNNISIDLVRVKD